MREILTKQQFLKRCETVYDKGLLTPKRVNLMERWLDFVLRYEAVFFSHVGQGPYLLDFMKIEHRRVIENNGKTLAGDEDGYALIQAAAILGHPCQACAEDPEAWHTRAAYCAHGEGVRR